MTRGKRAERAIRTRGPGFAKLRFGLQHVLVGDVHLLFEGIERGVVENLPPLAAQHSVAGLRFLPAGGRRFLVVRRHGGGRALIGGDFEAGGGEDGQEAEGEKKRRPSFARIDRLKPAPPRIEFSCLRTPRVQGCGVGRRGRAPTSAAGGRSTDRPPGW